MRPRVSVIIPLYGAQAAPALPAVVDAWLAQDVPCEVIVAAAEPLVDEAAARGARVLVAGGERGSPGVLRNLAAAHACGERLYCSDADVAPLGVGFLRAAIALAGDGVACQPWMYRLRPSRAALDPTRSGDVPPERSCFVHVGPGGELRSAGDERFRLRSPDGPLTDNDVLAVLPPVADRDLGLPNRRRWVAAFHWGSVLLDAGLFADVGGYCLRYRGWGSEDDDLLVKLAARRNLIRVWRADPSIACVHYEHPRQDVTSAQATRNRALLAERVAAGVEAMIAADRATSQTRAKADRSAPHTSIGPCTPK